MELGNKRKTELLFYLEYGASFGHSCSRQVILQCKKSSYAREIYRRKRAYDS